MQLDNLRDAAAYVKQRLVGLGYEIRTMTFVNNYKNMIITTRSPLAADESFFLKWEQRPYFSLGYEIDGGFPHQEKKGITINKGMYLDFIEPYQANILYANPDVVYHVFFNVFEEYSIDHVQRVNQEPVMALPFSKLVVWAQ